MDRSRFSAQKEGDMDDVRPLFRAGNPANTDQNASVDFSVISELKTMDEDGFPTLVEMLVTEFIENTPLQILEIRQGVISSDPHFKNGVYLLKKACAVLGAKRMVRLLHLIEEGKTSFHNTLLLIDGLEDEFFLVYNDLLPYSSLYSLMKSEGWV